MKLKDQLGKMREFTTPELVTELKNRKEELFNLRFQLATGHLADATRIREVRKEIARIHTVQRERELKIR